MRISDWSSDVCSSDLLDLPDHFCMSSGGAPLPHAIREAFFERYGYHVSPSYGLTEAPTVVAHSFDAVPPDGASGHALPHLEISIRDAEGRSEERRVGKECVSTCRSRWSPYT